MVAGPPDGAGSGDLGADVPGNGNVGAKVNIAWMTRLLPVAFSGQISRARHRPVRFPVRILLASVNVRVARVLSGRVPVRLV